MLSKIRQWLEHRQAIRRRWQADARALVAADEVYRWAKVDAEVARIAPLAEMDIDVVRVAVAEEERRRT